MKKGQWFLVPLNQEHGTLSAAIQPGTAACHALACHTRCNCTVLAPVRQNLPLKCGLRQEFKILAQVLSDVRNWHCVSL